VRTSVKAKGDVGGPLLASLLLHGALWGLAFTRAPLATPPPTSVGLQGNSIEVEAPTPELSAPSRTGADLGAEPGVARPAAPPPASPDPAPMTTTAPMTTAAPRIPARAPQRPTSSRAATAAAPRRDARSLEMAAGRGAASPPAVGSTAAGTFGQQGLPNGVKRLGYAFTRAIPAATPGDEDWQLLPPGRVGTIGVELRVDEGGKLGAAQRWQPRPRDPAPPEVLWRMVERTLLLLRAGQFALSGSNAPGIERLLIEVEITQGAPEGSGESVVVQKRFDGASPGRPGRAYFRFGSGRAVEAKVTIVPAEPG
jgi:hypothetical protein